jgi:hypothetical protein
VFARVGRVAGVLRFAPRAIADTRTVRGSVATPVVTRQCAPRAGAINTVLKAGSIIATISERIGRAGA